MNTLEQLQTRLTALYDIADELDTMEESIDCMARIRELEATISALREERTV